MNIKRGINRIGIVVGIVVALFGFYFGSDTYAKKAFLTVNFVFSNDFRSFIKYQYGVEVNKPIATVEFRGKTFRPYDYRDIIGEDALRSILNNNPKLKNIDPLSEYKSYFDKKGQTATITDAVNSAGSDIKIILVGIVSAAISFFITFYGIRGLYRLTNWLIEGFKEEH